ncbi:MAG: thioredoxin domain-containing protein [Rickettsiales bacterium]|jgi:protein-disulfide isomerase|nr:thioredoxin domain-containing protein [Rickettsiales bacterium]
MTWTIVILAVAAGLYLFANSLEKSAGKDGRRTGVAAKSLAQLVAIVLLVVGVGRLGVTTSYYSANKFLGTLQAAQNEKQQADQEEASRQVRKYVKENGGEMIKRAPVLGNEKGSKTIFVWSAADCPYCRRVHSELTRVIAENKDVRVVIKNFPVHGEISDIPGRWTIAAKLQSNEKAAALYEKIMDKPYWDDANRGDMKVVTNNMKKYAKEVGLDVSKLEKDLNGTEVSQELSQVRELAQQFQISGTPYLIINDKVFPGAIPYSTIVEALR